MSAWTLIAVQSVLTVLLVWLTLWGFHRWVLRPWVDVKIAELKAVSDAVDRKVSRGVEEGVGRALRRLPESTIRGTTRQMIRMGSGLMEGGLSTLLGSPAELRGKRKPTEEH